MAEDIKQPRGEWTRVQELDERLTRGERLIVDEELRALLRKVGDQLVLSPEYVDQRLASVEEAEALLREAAARITAGSRALSSALRKAWRDAESGKPDDACAVLEDFIRAQPIPWYRELARRESAVVPLRASRESDGEPHEE